MVNRWIFCGGMMRSGSTLQYQIASELIERRGIGRRTTYYPPADHDRVLAEPLESDSSTFKTHDLTPCVERLCRDGKAVALYTSRDIRDVVSSLQEKNDVRFTGEALTNLVKGLLQSDAAWRSLPCVYVARYEEMVTELEREVAGIAAFLGIDCPLSLVREIADMLSYHAQKSRIDAVEPSSWIEANRSNVYDSSSLLHKNHLQSGKEGRFRNDLDSFQIAAIEYLAGEWLLRRGYDLTENGFQEATS